MAREFSILVVDDDPQARLVMRAALRKAGFTVQLAVGGEDALRQFRSAPADMVMLDVEMPDIDGHEVCARLRAEAGPLLPIVMVTGMDDLQSVETAYERGATDFIAKPVNWSLLGHRVRYMFRSNQALLDLRAAQARTTAVLNAIPDLLLEVDIEGRCLEYRAPRGKGQAVLPQAVLQRRLSEMLPPHAAQVFMAALQAATLHGTAGGQQFELQQPQGPVWFELSVSRKADPDGESPRFIVLARDITDRKLAEARISRLAYFDGLTGLPNRQTFIDQVDRQIQRAAARHSRLAVLFMDLDGFKSINDTMGHAAGDRVLQSAAERLREGLREGDFVARCLPNDTLTAAAEAQDLHPLCIARLGGDEFTALIVDITDPQQALALAQRIGELMRRPFALEEREVMLTASMGIAIYPDDGTTADALLKHADTAMYHAKTSGRDHAQLYSASLTEQILRRMELDASLRRALERDEFHLVYQPQIDVASGRVTAVEALLRWTHPSWGLVSPLQFIPQAEENGLIAQIGRWVLRTACADAQAWQRAGTPVTVAVNLSPLHFGEPELPQWIIDGVTDSGLDPRLLELELTESALMGNTDATRTALHTLRAHGIQLALDDFGTGFSSLSYLTRMPIGHIKIDRSFVAGMLAGGEHKAIVRALLALARSLGMEVTAEGVETVEQARALQAMGCDRLQGFLFSRPVPAVDVPALLAQHWAVDEAAADTLLQPGECALPA